MVVVTSGSDSRLRIRLGLWSYHRTPTYTRDGSTPRVGLWRVCSFDSSLGRLQSWLFDVTRVSHPDPLTDSPPGPPPASPRPFASPLRPLLSVLG